MPVLDVRAVTSKQLSILTKAYDDLAEKELAPLAQLDKDKNRQQIDDVLSKVLKLPSVAPIRELLAREPGLAAVEINPRESQIAFESDDDEDVPDQLGI